MLIAGFDDTTQVPRAEPRPVGAVLFDFSNTIFHSVDTVTWLCATAHRVGTEMTEATARRLADELTTAWSLPGVRAAQEGRDLSPERHEAAVVAWARAVPELAPMAQALSDELRAPRSWVPYDDTRPVIAALRAAGLPVGVVSNIGWDLRGYFPARGIEVDTFALSCDLGVAKPDPRLFAYALDGLGADPRDVLMVGDTPDSDGAAAALGMRVLLLPRGGELARMRGLDAVLRLVGLNGMDGVRTPR
ncbi:MAG TPA: HAD-IA family hydrolase [Streptosporangiaceae bacterium]|jgi:HAD superfamily hydrolase (TIGR01509 family)